MSLNTTLSPFVAGTVVQNGQLNALVTALNSIQAPWDPWAPTWTGVTLGNGNVVARYLQIGKTIQARLSLVAGSTTTFAGAISFSLPVAQRADYLAGVDSLGSALLSRSTAASRTVATAYLGGGSTCGLIVDGLAGGYTTSRVVGSTVPWTWQTSDTLAVTLTYEAA